MTFEVMHINYQENHHPTTCMTPPMYLFLKELVLHNFACIIKYDLSHACHVIMNIIYVSLGFVLVPSRLLFFP